MSLGDLGELVMSCRTDAGRRYIAEAVTCYKAGAYRACIVSTWIAVVYDLLSKTRELALSGDKEAQATVDKVKHWQPLAAQGDSEAIRHLLSLERTILTLVHEKFEFFDGQQMLDVDRLHEDRNRCAHPTYQGTDQPYAASAELARTHLVHAVRHVLSQAPVRGKAATDQILGIVKSAYFPTDVEEAKLQLKNAGLERPRDNLIRTVADELVYGLFEDERGLKGRRHTASAIRAVCEMFPQEAEPRIRKALNSICAKARDDQMPYFISLQRHLTQAWEFLERANQGRLREVLVQSDADLAPDAVSVFLELKEMSDVCQERIGKFSHREMGILITKTRHPMAVKAAINLYCSSKSWDSANNNYNHAIEPIMDTLSTDQLRRILNAPTEEAADLRGSHSFNTFCKHVFQKEQISTVRDCRHAERARRNGVPGCRA